MKRRALVTGGNRGIGLAIAQRLANQGLDVWIGSRDLEAGQKAAGPIGVHVVQLDLKDKLSIQRAIDQIGELDVLINNAGVLFEDRLLAAPAAFEASIQVMVWHPTTSSMGSLPA